MFDVSVSPPAHEASRRLARIALAAVSLIVVSGLYGCFGTPRYEGRRCDARRPCPSGYTCSQPAFVCTTSDGSGREPGDDPMDDMGDMISPLITGKVTADYVTATGLVSVPLDMRLAQIAATVRDPMTGAFGKAITGAGSLDGQFIIQDVPPGEVYVNVGNIYVVTTVRTFDFGRFLLGRPSSVPATQPTSFSLNLGNLHPWAAEDSLHFFVPNTATFDWYLERGPITVAPGATSLSATLDYAQLPGRSLLDAGQGDVGYVTQLVSDRSSTGQEISILSRIYVVQGLTMVDGGAVTISGSFADVPRTQSLAIKACGSKLAALGSRVNPTSVPEEIGVDVLVNPLGSEHEAWESPRLFGYFGATSGSDVDLGTVTFGNPYPPSWTVYGVVAAYYLVNGTDHVVGSYSVVPMADLPRIACEPRLGPPEHPKVNGRDAFSAQAGVSMSPTFSWAAPREGRASIYILNIVDAENPGKIATGSFRTAATSITIPPGVLLPGHTYRSTLTVVSSGRSSAEWLKASLRSGLFYSQATAVLGTITP